MSRKKSRVGKFLVNIVKSIFTTLWWIIKSVLKGIFFLIVKLLELLSPMHYKLYSFIHREKREVEESTQVRTENKPNTSASKVPALYTALQAESTVKGSLESFTKVLEQESRIIAIAGKRGSGKSVLGFRILENIKAKESRPCFVIGVKQSILPSWITTIDSIEQVENKGVVLVDEGAISFGSRNSMSKKNKNLAGLLAIARHKDLTLIFITQNTGMIDRNVLNLCDTILLKEGSLLQEKMERSSMKDLYTTANKALVAIQAEERKSVFYVFDAEFEGLAKANLPGFWTTSVSKNQA
ncbi:MAG TPA: zonular occludens toxin domain-containing protein [Candidatus Nanoarchaeia archaeon]|nr:zonular occludens toxin domain-containing protein [Candidatus Nanoarchaeia archaeon]